MKSVFLAIYISLLSVNVSAQQYQWQPLPSGIICKDSSDAGIQDCYVIHLLSDTFHNLLWVAGGFDSVQGVSLSNYAAWDGNKFVSHHLISSSRSILNDRIMYNAQIAVASDNGVGLVDVTTGQTVGYWSSSGRVECLAVYNGDLIAGGKFFGIGGVAANSIARWDGTKWHPLGGGITGSVYIVYSMKVYNGKLYVGGAFDRAGSVDTWNIASWDGTDWSQVGGIGTEYFDTNHNAAAVFAMDVFQNKLYASGRFYYMNGIPTHLAYWDGSTWTGTNYPYGTDIETRRMKASDSLLYLTAWGAQGAIYSWDGASTALVDSGVNSSNPALEIFQGTLYTGGNFDSSGNTPVFHLARLMWDTTKVYTPVKTYTAGDVTVSVYPNPGSGEFTIELSNPQPQNNEAEITVTNLLGQVVQSHNYSLTEEGTIRKQIVIAHPGQYILVVKLGSEYYHSSFVSFKD